MATSRLRKAFMYPQDDSMEDNAPGEGIDEEEQDKVIEDLQKSDAETTSLYRFVLSSAIYAIAVFYLGVGIIFSGTQNVLGSVTMIISAFLIDRERWKHPLLIQPPKLSPRLGFQFGYQLDFGDEILVLASILTISALFIASADGLSWDAPWPPAVMFGVALLARWLLQPINVAELQRLKYSYKGA